MSLDSLRGKTVENVPASGLCTGCGTCAGICSVGAIEMRLDDGGNEIRPCVRADECTGCGQCLEVCPGTDVNFEQLNQDTFGAQPKDPLIGVVRATWVAHSTDEALRWRASSGGAATELCAFALDEKLIDGAVVVHTSADSPLRPVPVIATSRDELVAASGSKYCPVPVNSVLGRLRSRGGRYAILGVSCHVHGVRKAVYRDESLRKVVAYAFGLACGRLCGFFATEYYLQRRGIRLEDVAELRYRGEGWPGKISVTLKDGSSRVFPRRYSARRRGRTPLSAFSTSSRGGVWRAATARQSWRTSRSPTPIFPALCAPSERAVPLSWPVASGARSWLRPRARPVAWSWKRSPSKRWFGRTTANCG